MKRIFLAFSMLSSFCFGMRITRAGQDYSVFDGTQSHTVKPYMVDPLLKRMNPKQLQRFIEQGNRIKAIKLSDGDYRLQANVPGLGGGPVGFAIGYGITKALIWSGIIGAGVGAVAATGGAALGIAGATGAIATGATGVVAGTASAIAGATGTAVVSGRGTVAGLVAAGATAGFTAGATAATALGTTIAAGAAAGATATGAATIAVVASAPTAVATVAVAGGVVATIEAASLWAGGICAAIIPI